MANILLVNEKRSKMDLSAVKDAKGEMIILQPRGTKDSTRECPEEVLAHPHVIAMINVKWLSHRPISLKPTQAAPAPEKTPPPPPAPEVVPPPVDEPPAPAEEPVPAEASTPENETADPVVLEGDPTSTFTSGSKKDKDKKSKRTD